MLTFQETIKNFIPMKNLLIFALLMSFSLGLFAQAGIKVLSKQLVTSDTITTDTTYWIKTSDNYAWRLYVEFTGNDGTTSTMIPVTKTNATGTQLTYPGISAYTFTGATGAMAFSDPAGQVDNYIGLYVDLQAGKTVVMNVWYYLTEE